MGYATKSTAESSYSVSRIFQHTQTSSCGRGDDVAVDDNDDDDDVPMMTTTMMTRISPSRCEPNHQQIILLGLISRQFGIHFC
jgi:hypothetical protein